MTMTTSTPEIQQAPPREPHAAGGHWLEDWRPEDPVFWETTGKPIARRNLIFSIFAVIMVGVMLWRAGTALTTTSVALALILGGAIGNLYDRVRYHFVIDFIEVHIVHYHWPDFNVADSCIVIGACLLFIEIFRSQPTNS